RDERADRVPDHLRAPHRLVGDLEGCLTERENAKERRLTAARAHFRVQQLTLAEPHGCRSGWRLETHHPGATARFERGQEVRNGNARYLAAQCRSSVGTAGFSGLHSGLLAITRTIIPLVSAVKACFERGSARGLRPRAERVASVGVLAGFP